MYQKPEVYIVEPQQIQTTPVDVTSSEAAKLLAKYGYKSPEFNNPNPTPTKYDPTSELTVGELYEMQDRIERERIEKEHQMRYGPKSVTFDSRNINYSNSDYRDMDIDGQNIGIQIQVVSDMPINNRKW